MSGTYLTGAQSEDRARGGVDDERSRRAVLEGVRTASGATEMGSGAEPATEAPHRVQLSRRAGWRKPANTVVVSRPSKWGNPFRLGTREGLACVPGAMTGEAWEYEDRISAPGQRHDFFHPGDRVTRCNIRELTRAEAVLLFREQLTGHGSHIRDHSARTAGLWWNGKRLTVADVRAELAGKNLACWCPLDEPCHADMLLQIANS